MSPSRTGAIVDVFPQAVLASEENSTAVIRVRDAGVGIPADLHGGRVDVRSDGIGTGSEFTVRLPVMAAAV